MWKVSLFVFLYLGACLVSGGRVPRSALSEEEECEIDEDCREGFECFEETYCHCKEGYVKSGSECLLMATESQNSCQVQLQCGYINGSVCVREHCVIVKELSESCTEHEECNSLKELVCESGTCQCPAGKVEFESECLPKVVKLGDSCQESVQCMDLGGTCDNGTCQNPGSPPCSEDFVESDDGKSCLRKAESLGDACLSTSQCKDVNGTCLRGLCVLVTEFGLPAVSAAVPEILIASPCNTDAECSSVPNSVCKEFVCQCRVDYVTSDDLKRCLLMARKLGDECEIDKQCGNVRDSFCSNNMCLGVAAAGVKTGSNAGTSTTSSLALITFLALWTQIWLK